MHSFLDRSELAQWLEQVTKVGTWYVDLVESKAYWSVETYRIHELDPDIEIDLAEAINFYHEEDRPTINEAVQTAMENGHPWDVVLRIITAEQNLKTVRAAGRPVYDANKKLIGLEGIFQELDLARSMSEDAAFLSRKSRHLEKVVDNILIIAKTDVRGNITYVNDLFCEISKYSRDELIGQNHRLINSGYHTKEFFQDMWREIAAGKAWRGQIRNRAKDGKIYWVDTQIVANHDSQGKIYEYVAFRMDITSQMERIDEELKLAKLAAVGETTAQIIHDVMNPLTIIQGNAEKLESLVDRQDWDAAKISKASERIQHAVDRIQELFQSLRKGLIHDSVISDIQMRGLVTEVYNDLAEMAQSNRIRLQLSEADFSMKGDRSKLRQALTNLVKNAIDAVKDQAEPWVEVDLIKIGAYKIIRITDSGTGIDPSLHEQIFESLFSTKIEKGGTGLGLGLVKKIIEAHGGTIRVNPESPNTQFEIRFRI